MRIGDCLSMKVTLLTLLDAITEKGQMSLGLSILFAVIFYIFDIILFFSAYSIRMYSLMEYGYPKRSEKYRRRKKRSYPFVERILMYKVAKNAERKCKLVTLELSLQFFNLFSFVISTVGFVATIVTRFAGWAGLLVLCTQLFSFFVQVIIDWLPSRIFCREIQKQSAFSKVYEKIYRSYLKHKK